MNASSRWPSIRRHAAALFALWAVAVVAPPAVRAGCGDHVGAGSSFFDVASLTGLEIFGEAPPTVVAVAEAPSRGRSPCSGMSCSQAPSLPLVPASNGSVRLDQWGCLASPRPPAPEPFESLPAEVSARPIHAGLPLDRPPR